MPTSAELTELEQAMLDPVRTAKRDGEELQMRSADELIKLHQYSRENAAGRGPRIGMTRISMTRRDF